MTLRLAKHPKASCLVLTNTTAGSERQLCERKDRVWQRETNTISETSAGEGKWFDISGRSLLPHLSVIWWMHVRVFVQAFSSLYIFSSSRLPPNARTIRTHGQPTSEPNTSTSTAHTHTRPLTHFKASGDQCKDRRDRAPGSSFSGKAIERR
jgi:hypothetical protein